jgi:hypothetical protein
LKINNNEGNSLVELVMVMMFLILLGATVYTLIFAGITTQEQMTQQKNAQMNARIALSYVEVRVRQNDTRNKIEIKENEINGKNSIVIQERGRFGSYDVWIYWANGWLRQEVTEAGGQPIGLKYNKISEINYFDVTLDENGLISTYITYNYKGSTKTIVNKIYIRSN